MTELSTPQKTALGSWFMDGNSSLTNPLIRRVGELILRPAGMDYSEINYDAFAAAKRQTPAMMVVSPRFYPDAAKQSPSVYRLWEPVFKASEIVQLVIIPPFVVSVQVDESGDSEVVRPIVEALQGGLQAQINASYRQIIEAAQATVDICMHCLLSDDKEAVRAYLAAPDALPDLIVARGRK